MKPRERVLTALEHSEPDRIPFDLGATVNTGIHYVAYGNLVNYLEKPHLARDRRKYSYMDFACGIIEIDEEVVRELGIDARGTVEPDPPKWDEIAEEENGYQVFTDEMGARWFKPEDGFYFDQKSGSFPLANVDTVECLKDQDWPDFSSPERTEGLREKIRSLGDDYAICIGDPIGGILASGFRLRGYKNFYLDLARNRKFSEALMDSLLKLKLDYWGNVLDEVKDLIDVVVYEDDLGQQDRTIISPKLYRDLVKPRHRELFSFIRSRTNDPTYIQLHSDGSIVDIIPDLIEIGVDIINPVQVGADDMDSKFLKKRFGDDIVFWGGGIDTQKVLSFKTPDEVKEEVKKRIDDFAPSGGFVFSSIDNIQPEVPPENIMAMWKTLKNYGVY